MEIRAEKRSGDSGWREASYRAGVRVDNPGGLDLAGGEPLVLAGSLRPLTGYANPGGFDWREYRGRRMVAGQLEVEDGGHVRILEETVNQFSQLPEFRRLAALLHARLHRLHDQLYPDPEIREMAGAILLGERAGLDDTLEGWFVESGTVHVLVVSGLHLGFIAGAVYLFFVLLLGRSFTAAWLTSTVLLVYAMAAGGRPSVMRAWLLITFALFALPAGRQRAVLNSLAAAFALLLMVNPSWLTDAGFQLSFAAVGGIGLVMPIMERRVNQRDWWRNRLWRWLFRLVAISAVAQLAVAPLLACHFHRFSPAAFVANPPVVALAGFSVLGGFLADLVGLVWLDAGRLAAGPVAWSLGSMAEVARWFAGFEWSSLAVPVPGAVDLVFCWLLLWSAASWFGGKRSDGGRLVVILLLWLNVALWGPLAAGRYRRLDVTFLDLGEATAPVVRFPDGSVLLADQTGQAGFGAWSAVNLVGPYLRRHTGSRLDYLLLRGRGAARRSWTYRIMEDFRPEAVLFCHPEPFAGATADFLAYCSSRGIAVRLVTETDTMVAGGARFTFDRNAEAPSFEYGNHRLVLAGESELDWNQVSAGVPGGKGADIIEWREIPEPAGGSRHAGSGSPWVISPAHASRNTGEKNGKILSTRDAGAITFGIGRRSVEIWKTRAKPGR